MSPSNARTFRITDEIDDIAARPWYPGGMTTVWRAADLAPSEREDSFVDLVCNSIVSYDGSGDMVLEDRDTLRTADVGMLRIMQFTWGRGSAVRKPKHVRQIGRASCRERV